MSSDNIFRKWLRKTKGVTISQAETYGKQLGLSYQQIKDEVAIVNGYVGRKQWINNYTIAYLIGKRKY